MQTNVLKGGLAALCIGLIAIVAPAGKAQSHAPRDPITVGEKDPGPTVQQAQQLQRAQRWEEAAAAWRAIAQREPGNGQAVFNLGYCLHTAGRIDEALQVHLRAAEFEEYRGIALYNVACAHALQGDAEAAIQALAASQAAGFSLANALEDADLDSLHDDARFQALLARPAPSRGFLGRLQQMAGQARMLYVQYAPEVKQNLDTMRVEAEAQAEVLAQMVMRDERLGPIVMRVMRLVHGGPPAAGAGTGGIEESHAGNTTAPSLKEAQRLQQAQQWGAAAGAYAAVLEREPENVVAVFGHAYCLHMSGDYAAAIEAHQRAATFPQLRGISLYNLGCAYALTGEIDKAFESLELSRKAGFDMKSQLKTDTDLDSLRKDPRFAILVARVNGGL